MLNQINQKMLMLILSGFFLLVLATSSVYGIIPQVKEIKAGIIKHDELKEIITNRDELNAQKLNLVETVEQLKRDLRGDMANLPEKKMEAFIIGELQNISWNHKINLIGVKPYKGNEIQMFQELLFNVQLSGEYFDLYKWLEELRTQLGFIVIKNLEINLYSASEKDSLLRMKLTIASYKSIKE